MPFSGFGRRHCRHFGFWPKPLSVVTNALYINSFRPLQASRPQLSNHRSSNVSFPIGRQPWGKRGNGTKSTYLQIWQTRPRMNETHVSDCNEKMGKGLLWSRSIWQLKSSSSSNPPSSLSLLLAMMRSELSLLMFVLALAPPSLLSLPPAAPFALPPLANVICPRIPRGWQRF
jgi:hypothetical protein